MFVMKSHMKVVVFSAGFILLICLSLGIGLKIYTVNTQALSIPLEKYNLHEEVFLDGSFITSSKEMTLGYSLTVNNVFLLSQNEYIKKYGEGSNISDEWNAKSIIEVEITIRNEGNSEGYLDVMGWRLVPERGNEYFIPNSSLWQIGEPNAPGVTSALSLIPNSEYTVNIPFVRNVGEEEMFIKDISDTRFSLVVSDAPVKKEIGFEIEV